LRINRSSFSDKAFQGSGLGLDNPNFLAYTSTVLLLNFILSAISDMGV